ncbi:hypothetical protein [Celerinatantimonas sp. MCCC 1A17872]
MHYLYDEEQGLWHRHTQTLQSNVKRLFEDAANDPVHCDLRWLEG